MKSARKSMIPLTIHLTREQYRKLVTDSLRSGRSMTAIIRTLVDKRPVRVPS